MASSRVFADTWAWLVLANDRDPSFADVAAARAAAVGRQTIWVTTDYVLDETMTRLFASTPFRSARKFMEGIFEAARQGSLDIEHITPDRFIQAWRMRLRYQDKPRISFTDLTSFAVMSELGIRHVLAGDA